MNLTRQQQLGGCRPLLPSEIADRQRREYYKEVLEGLPKVSVAVLILVTMGFCVWAFVVRAHDKFLLETYGKTTNQQKEVVYR